MHNSYLSKENFVNDLLGPILKGADIGIATVEYISDAVSEAVKVTYIGGKVVIADVSRSSKYTMIKDVLTALQDASPQADIKDGIEIISVAKVGNWVDGKIDGIHFSAKVFEEGSCYGIDGGNISKLTIIGILDYDRGCDKKPRTKQGKNMLERLLKFFEGWKY